MFREARVEKDQKHIYKVSELVADIRLILESSFAEIWVEGEISNFTAQASGHFYFTLKDENNVLPAVMFFRANRQIKFKIENGLKVICFGKVSAYGPRGQYQIIVEKIEPQGIGALQLALEQLKEKLEKEGLFGTERKRKIPDLPAKIGIVTSLSGAAIKDILKVLERRFSNVHIVIRPALVQGEGAAEDIACAIREMNEFNATLKEKDKIEVMIVGRGGGSIEDLWAFNEEIVARAIYQSAIPIISGVGHERDWTIADLVADVRAATPSVAAETVILKREELKEEVYDYKDRLTSSFLDIFDRAKDNLQQMLQRLALNIGHDWELGYNRLNANIKKLSLLNPLARLAQYQTKTMDFAKQIYVRIEHFLKLKNTEFRALIEKLNSLSPLNILSRGYSITFVLSSGEILKEAASVKEGEKLKTRLYKGEVFSQVFSRKEE